MPVPRRWKLPTFFLCVLVGFGAWLRREAVGKSPRDPKSVEITLRREGYRVELHGDGTVLYQGWRFVAFTGTHRGSIPKKTFQEILEQFLKINYYSLSGEYGPYVTDTQVVETSLNIDGKSNSVRRWEGVTEIAT